MKLKDHNEYMPPNWVDIFEQEIDWVKHSYFTFDAAVREFWDRLPNKDELQEAINAIPWNCKEKANVLNIPFAGWRFSGISWDDVGSGAYLWSSSSQDASDAYYVCLQQSGDDAGRNWNRRSDGLSVRLLDTSETTSSLWLFDEVIEKLELLEKEKRGEADKIWEAIKLIRNLK